MSSPPEGLPQGRSEPASDGAPRATTATGDRRDAWLKLLSNALDACADQADPEAVLRAVSVAAVSGLADGCCIDAVEADGSCRRIVEQASSPEVERQLCPWPDAAQGGVWREVLRAGRPEPFLVTSGRAGGREPATDGASALVVPIALAGGESAAGAPSNTPLVAMMTLLSASATRPYDAADLVPAELLARQLSTGLAAQRCRREVEQAQRARDDFLSLVSHDLRNPLGVVMASCSLLLKTPLASEKDGRARRQLEAIQRAGTRMNRLIRDLLDLANIQAGRLTLTKRPSDAIALASSVLTGAQPAAAEKSIQLVAELDTPALEVLCDSDRLSQALANVVGNGIRFTPDGGTVTLRVEAVGSEVHFVVSDTGPGIEPEQVEHLFDRAWHASRKNRDGVGLGLPITKGLVEAQGGRVWVSSELGRGTTVGIALAAGASPSST